MRNTIHIERRDVPASILAATDYRGRKWSIEIKASIHVSSQQWSGSSRTTYFAIDLESGYSGSINDRRPWPENMTDLGTQPLRKGIAVIERVIFCGKDLGVRIHLHPDNATALLPKPTVLNEDERTVLSCGSGGKMAFETFNSTYGNVPINWDNWIEVVEGLVLRGFMKTNGALTTAGKNARPTF